MPNLNSYTELQICQKLIRQLSLVSYLFIVYYLLLTLIFFNRFLCYYLPFFAIIVCCHFAIICYYFAINLLFHLPLSLPSHFLLFYYYFAAISSFLFATILPLIHSSI